MHHAMNVQAAFSQLLQPTEPMAIYKDIQKVALQKATRNDLKHCADIASEMLLVDAISQHWQHIFSERVLVVPYERIVMDLEGAARDMLSHCRLPWDDSVLHFHQNLRTVQTASLAQVCHVTCTASCLPVNADARLTAKCSTAIPLLLLLLLNLAASAGGVP